MTIHIKSINDSKIELFFNKKNITIITNNDYEKIIIYRDLVIYISLLTIDSGTMYLYENNEKYIDWCINSIICILNNNEFPIGIGYGYSGIGYMLYILSYITNKYEILHNDIDKKIINYLNIISYYGFKENNMNNLILFLDYFKGLIGVLNYLDIEQNDDDIIKKIIIKLSENFIMFQKQCKMPLGIAHGYSGMLLFLIRTRYLSIEEKKVILKKIQQEFIQYDNLDIRDNELSWENGKYGQLYVIILLKKLLGISFENEKKELFNLCNFNKKYTHKKNMCSGINGCQKMAINLYKYKLISNEELNDLIKLISDRYMINSNFPSCYSVKEMSVINGIFAESLITKLNKKGEKIYSKYFMI